MTSFESVTESWCNALDKTFVAGAAAVAVPPDDAVGIRLAGFDLDRHSSGMIDPPYVRALYVCDGQTALALVSADFIGLMNPDVCRMCEMAGGKLQDNIVIACTHNHQAPDTIGFWGRGLFGAIPISSGVDPGYMQKLERAIVDAVSQAAEQARPSRARFGRSEADRRLVMNLRNADDLDTEMTVAAFDGADGQRICTLVNFACHPETLYDKNADITADYPGVLCQSLERSEAGVALFFSAALGGMITANIEEEAPLKEKKEFMYILGEKLADCARTALAGGKTVFAPEVKYARKSFEFKVDNKRFKLVGRLGVIDRDMGEAATSEIAVGRIGPLSFATAPGELLPELGRSVKNMLPGKYRLLICLGLDETGYILPEEYFSDPKYRYEMSMSLGRKTAGVYLDNLKKLAEQNR
jgi:hypothetical protein